MLSLIVRRLTTYLNTITLIMIDDEGNAVGGQGEEVNKKQKKERNDKRTCIV